MLWVNMIMDTLASLALATEPPTMALLDRQPHSRSEYIVTKKMFKHILGQSAF
jgi:Ca2+ transporting ATPase